MHIQFSSMKPTLTWWGGLTNQEVSTSVSIERPRWSDATTLKQNRFSIDLLQGLDLILKFVVTLAFL